MLPPRAETLWLQGVCLFDFYVALQRCARNSMHWLPADCVETTWAYVT
jgi:hypothetical protein